MINERDGIPRGDEARRQWFALGHATQRAAIKSARRGHGVEDRRNAEIAIGWAWNMLGEPGSRSRIRWWQVILGIWENVGYGAGDIFDGGDRRKYNLYVRHIARLVERANWDGPDE